MQFTAQQRDTIYSVIHARRDMRHFIPDSSVAPEVLQRILLAANSAPSVGLMQPWRFIRLHDNELRHKIKILVDEERLNTAEKLQQRKQDFLKLKIEGITDCAELVAVVQSPDDGTILGRHSMPEEMALCSTACAIENMWLASRAENIGMGWVSFFQPKKLASLLNCPQGSKPIALLCLGPVKQFYSEPMLQQEKWRQAKSLEKVLFHNSYGNTKHENNNNHKTSHPVKPIRLE